MDVEPSSSKIKLISERYFFKAPDWSKWRRTFQISLLAPGKLSDIRTHLYFDLYRMTTYGLYKMMRLNHIRRINVAILPLLIYKLMKLMLMDLIW